MKEVLKEAINDICQTLNWPEVSFVVEHPADLTHGDYACNVALILAKQVGQSPKEVAEKLLATLQDSIEYVDKIEVAGPGFLNFYLSRDFFAQELARINELGDEWGRNTSWQGKRVLVEYTDPNPFKEFHVGHLFTNAVGESMARLFLMQGAETLRLNYQGDVGLHVACALWGMQQLGLSPDSDFSARELGKAYALGATAYKNEESSQLEIRAINKEVYERTNDTINNLYDSGRAVSLAYFEHIYSLVDTKFDAYFFESEAGPKGKELVFSHPEVFPESEGARIFKGEDYGLHTRVFINKEGLPTYEAKELALAKLKEERLGVYEHSIICTANEVSEYFKVLRRAMQEVYPDLAEKTEHVGHGMVRLASGKMSSRTGDVIAAIDFIDEVAEAARAKMAESGHTEPDELLARDVAIAAIKYSTLRGNVHQNSVFDKDQALSFEGDSGPYLQYTHARIASVLDKAKVAGVEPAMQVLPDTAFKLERIVYQFPEVIEEAFLERSPHKVAQFITVLAGEFNTFYASERIADVTDVYASYKATLTAAVGQTIKNGLWVLGIKAPDEM